MVSFDRSRLRFASVRTRNFGDILARRLARMRRQIDLSKLWSDGAEELCIRFAIPQALLSF
jgi:hypothetical protein